MSMEDFARLLLGALATVFYEPAIWRGVTIAGRFRIDPHEDPLGGIEPGLGVVQTWFWCDRRIVPPPLPELGDHLTIRGQVWEIVQRDEDDLGELGFRLIKDEQGLAFPDAAASPEERRAGRPSRRREIVEAFESAANAGMIGPDTPVNYAIAAVRARIPGDRRGLGDKTLRRTIAPMIARRRQPSPANSR